MQCWAASHNIADLLELTIPQSKFQTQTAHASSSLSQAHTISVIMTMSIINISMIVATVTIVIVSMDMIIVNMLMVTVSTAMCTIISIRLVMSMVIVTMVKRITIILIRAVIWFNMYTNSPGTSIPTCHGICHGPLTPFELLNKGQHLWSMIGCPQKECQGA